MTLQFNTQPYYDDFDENKNFHRILFKPGVSVQARELTQSQSILQDQIGKLGKFVLSDGSKVTDGRYFIDTNTKSLKLQNTGTLVSEIQNFNNLYVVGQTSKCVAIITNVDIINLYITTKAIVNGKTNFISDEILFIFDSKSLAFSNSINPNITPTYTTKLQSDSQVQILGVYGYINSNKFTINSSSLEIGDMITIPSADNPYDSYVVIEIGSNGEYFTNKTLDEDYINIAITVSKFASRDVMEIGFDDGVYFTNNHFVKAVAQKIIPNLKTQYPSCVVGYEVSEYVIDFIDDPSLLDPAQSSYNYTAPGADRYKIYLELVSKPFIAGEIQNLTNKKFIELLRIKNGIVVKDNTNPVLGDLEKTLAKQMYDHAGNFIVKDFSISFHDSDFKDSQTKIKAEISPGKAYVLGHEFEQAFPTFFEIEKSRDVISVTNYESSVYYGNHFSVTKPTGMMLNPQSSARVELHSALSNAVNLNTFIAYAYIRNVRYVSDNEYSLYLYNISSSDISNVKSVVIPTSSKYSSFLFSTDTIQINGKLPIVDPGFNSLLFELPKDNIASINNVSIAIDKYSVISVVSNAASIHSGSYVKRFSSGLGTLSSDQKKANFIVVANSTNGGYVAGQYVDLAHVVIVISQASPTSEHIAAFTFSNGYTGQISIKYSLDIIDANEKIKTEVSDYVSTVYADTYPSSLLIADISKFNGVFYSPYPSATYIGAWNSGTSYSKDNVVLVGGVLFSSLINSNLNKKPSTSSSSWVVLQNVTKNYILNDGQTESFYDHGTITAKKIIDVKQVFVLFNYYTHSVSGEFLSFNSYQKDYSKIPSSIINNKTYDFKKFIDFRPRRVNNSLSLQFDNYDIPSTLFTGMSYDFSYYLGRIDKLILTDSKKFQWLKGISSYNTFVPPSDIANAMTIATIQINPYTFSQKDILIKYKKHRRYTMDDIGNLDYRISNVEYYTSLNMVEKDVMSRNIYDSVTGNRMKNGFVVDPFIGYGVMSISENYKNCSLDLTEQTLRPSFVASQLNTKVSDLKTLKNSSDIISFPYTEELVASQTSYSSTINCNPFDVVSYSGTLTLNPQSNIWVDIENNPIINHINDDLIALQEALVTPGKVYNDWNSFYATHPYTKETESKTTASQNKAIYNVSSAVVLQSDITEEISSNIIPFAKSIDIEFSARHLMPQTRMFVYVNGRMVNAYITPKFNPLGQICSAQVTNVGTGYAANTIGILIEATHDTTALLNYGVVGTSLEQVEITQRGLGYPTSNTIAAVVSGLGSSAVVNISTTPQMADNLYSDLNGECSGILSLPNNDILRFPSGELHIIICDNPNYDPTTSISKAEAIFYSSGKRRVLQETITSIREPYLKFVGWEPPTPTQGGKIVVLDTEEYFVRNDNYDYSIIKSKNILLPVFLNKSPNSSVVVSFSNASQDEDSPVSYTITPSTLTFSSANFATPQYFTLSYDLGDRESSDLDNTLFQYLEYYGTSADAGYNYIGTTPCFIWKTEPTTGISYTKFISKVIQKPVPIPAKIICSSIPESQAEGKTEFFVSPWGEKLISHLPIVFNLSPANSSICTITGITSYANTEMVNTNSITISKLEDLNPFKVQVSFTDVGNVNTKISIASTSGSSYWNGVTSNTIFYHTANTIPAPPPAIVIQPSTEIPRFTNEDGKTTVIAIKLSANPYANVTIKGNSSNWLEGIVDKKSEDGNTIASGNTVTFTTSDWYTQKTLIVTGQPDSNVDGPVFFDVNLTSNSSNTSWNTLSSSLVVLNRDTTVLPPFIPGNILLTYFGGNRQTSESGNVAALVVSLDKKPKSEVFITSTSSNILEGDVLSGRLISFSTTNWNVTQNVVVKGIPDSLNDGLTNYSVDLFSSSTDAEFNLLRNTAQLSNIDTTAPPAPGEVVSTFDGNQTSETGGTVTGSFKLSKAPTSSVSLSIISDSLEGKITSGGVLIFTTTNWNTYQSCVITGQNDNVFDTNKTYNLIWKTTSSDYLFNAQTYSKILTNVAITAPPTGSIRAILNGTNATSETGSTVSISVTLSRAPLTTITVSASSNDSTEGTVTSGSNLTFTSSNWNTSQLVTVTGVNDGIVDGDILYNILFVASTSALDPNGFSSASVALINTNIQPATFVESKITSSAYYYVESNITPETWTPSVTVVDRGTSGSAGGTTVYDPTPLGQTNVVISATSDGTIKIKSSGWVDDDQGHNNPILNETYENSWHAAYRAGTNPNKYCGTYNIDLKLTAGVNSKWAPNALSQITPTSNMSDCDKWEMLRWSGDGIRTPADAHWRTRTLSEFNNTPNEFNYRVNLYCADAWINAPEIAPDPEVGFFHAGPRPGALLGNGRTWEGWAHSTVTIRGIQPNYSNFGIVVKQVVTAKSWAIVKNTTSGTIISETETSSSVGQPSIVWSWASGAASGTGRLNQQAYNILYTYFNRYAVTIRPLDGALYGIPVNVSGDVI